MEEVLLSKEERKEEEKRRKEEKKRRKEEKKRRKEEVEKEGEFLLLCDVVKDFMSRADEKYRLDQPLDEKKIKLIVQKLRKIVKKIKIEKNFVSLSGDNLATQAALFFFEDRENTPGNKDRICNMMLILEKAGFDVEHITSVEGTTPKILAAARS